MKTRAKSGQVLTREEKSIFNRLRQAFRQVSDKAPADRIAAITVVAFRSEFPESNRENNYGNALIRGIPARRRLLAEEGGGIVAREVGKRLGFSETKVISMYRRRTLIGWWDQFDNVFRFPVWQFKDKGLIPGIEQALDVLRAAQYMDDMGIMLFFLSQYHSLDGQRPLDCLREGRIEEVVKTAHGYVEW
jgi:hypothetical protein